MIGKLIRPNQLEAVTKYLELVLSQRAELKVCVLQIEVCQLHLVDDFFSDLRADWYPERVHFFLNFLVLTILSRAKSDIVESNKNEFAREPGLYLILAFARARPCICIVVALFEQENEGACLC